MALLKTGSRKALRCKARNVNFVQRSLNGFKQEFTCSAFNFKQITLDVSKHLWKKKWSYGQGCLVNLNQFIRNPCCWITHNDILQVNFSRSGNPLFKKHFRKALPGRHDKESFPRLSSCTLPTTSNQSLHLKKHSWIYLLSYPSLGAFWISLLSGFLPPIQPTPGSILWCKSDYFTPLSTIPHRKED